LIHPGTFTQKPCPMFHQLDASTPIKGGSTDDKDTSARNAVDKGTFLMTVHGAKLSPCGFLSWFSLVIRDGMLRARGLRDGYIGRSLLSSQVFCPLCLCLLHSFFTKHSFWSVTQSLS
jgi:hypothetical protein